MTVLPAFDFVLGVGLLEVNGGDNHMHYIIWLDSFYSNIVKYV